MQIQGAIIQKSVDSKLLAGNPAGVPSERVVTAYVPPHQKGESFPVLYCLAPWTSAGRTLLDWRPFKESLPERAERLVNEGKMKPAVIVCPDLYTDFGGSQYIDSDFFGPHGKFLAEELFEYVESEFPVKQGSAHRGVFGRSSGGFGALRLAMDYPGSVAAVASHSGDLGFDSMFLGDLVTLPKGLARYDNSIGKFLAHLKSVDKISGHDIHLLMLIGNAGFYSPDLKSPDGIALPIDLYSGRVIDEIWAKWREQDPVERIDETSDSYKQLSYLYVECGTKDQFNLLYGARQFAEKLTSKGIKHDYEEFDDNHSGTDYRYDVSLPRMVAALA